MSSGWASKTEPTFQALERAYYNVESYAIDLSEMATKFSTDLSNLNMEQKSAICYELAYISAEIDWLDSFLDHIDQNDQMLFAFPKKEHYFRFRNQMKSQTTLGLSSCRNLLLSNSDTEIKEYFLVLLSETKHYVDNEAENISLITELFIFWKNWTL